MLKKRKRDRKRKRKRKKRDKRSMLNYRIAERE